MKRWRWYLLAAYVLWAATRPPSNRRSMPFRRLHQHLPHWIKVILNVWMRRYGDPGDATDPARRR